MIIDEKRLLLEAGPLEPGAFYLESCVFIETGENVPQSNRCDNLSYSSRSPVWGTPYQNETWETEHKSEFDDFELTVKSLEKWGHVMSPVPHFFIDFIQIKQTGKDGSSGPPDLQTSHTPMSMWFGRSIYQLFKTMREWSFMIEEPFNCDHPMALLSKQVFEVLEVPQIILNEIDAMPDMHLAKFLKGQDDYKIIPPHPSMSQNFKQWIINTCEKYPELTFEQKMNAALEIE
jgi:hypothetical protein